jgi:hypothetical protein
VSLTNAPGPITALRDMVIACAAATAAGITTAKVFYPSIALDSDDATTPVALPACLLAYEQVGRTRYAEGSTGLPSGTLLAVFYFSAATNNTGQVETFGNTLASELMLLSQSAGLPITDIAVDRASDPTGGMRAETVSNWRAIAINITYGLRA